MPVRPFCRFIGIPPKKCAVQDTVCEYNVMHMNAKEGSTILSNPPHDDTGTCLHGTVLIHAILLPLHEVEEIVEQRPFIIFMGAPDTEHKSGPAPFPTSIG
jgi:hypothetical protein